MVFVAQAFRFGAEARVMPLLVGIPGILFCVFQLANDLKSTKTETLAFFSAGELPIIWWLIATTVAIVLFGFSFGGPPMVAAYLILIAKEKYITVFLSSIFCFLLTYVFFDHIMHAGLFKGLLF